MNTHTTLLPPLNSLIPKQAVFLRSTTTRLRGMRIATIVVPSALPPTRPRCQPRPRWDLGLVILRYADA